MTRRPPRLGTTLALVVCLALLSAGAAACGAPQFTYVADGAAHTYFKVPNGWRPVDGPKLAAAINGGHVVPGMWSAGYDASGAPSVGDALSSTATQPFALALVGTLSPAASSALSYDGLRDIYLPVTSAARQGAAQKGFPLTGFRLLRNTVITPGQGVHGVWVTFDYTYPGGHTDTFDQIALTNADSTQVYLLVVHCLASCFSQHQSEIAAVMSSFTVRSP